jgi:hypothetical protein
MCGNFKLTAHHHLMPKSRMFALPLRSPYFIIARCFNVATDFETLIYAKMEKNDYTREVKIVWS